MAKFAPLRPWCAGLWREERKDHEITPESTQYRLQMTAMEGAKKQSYSVEQPLFFRPINPLCISCELFNSPRISFFLSFSLSMPEQRLDLYLSWTDRVLEEFFSQGDEEASRGFPVTATPQCDRSVPGSLANGQRGFINFVVKPLFTALAAFSAAAVTANSGSSTGVGSQPGDRMDDTVAMIESNLSFWDSVDEKQKATSGGGAVQRAPAKPSELPRDWLPTHGGWTLPDNRSLLPAAQKAVASRTPKTAAARRQNKVFSYYHHPRSHHDDSGAPPPSSVPRNSTSEASCVGNAGRPTKEGSDVDMDVPSGVENRSTGMEKYDPPRSVTATKVNEDVSNVNEATMSALREENKQLSDRLSVLEKQLLPNISPHEAPAQLQRSQVENAVLESSWSTPTTSLPPLTSTPCSTKRQLASTGAKYEYSDAAVVGSRVRALQSQISELEQKKRAKEREEDGVNKTHGKR